MDKYDVFISCKSEDYVYAEDIYNFLRDNGINAFLTSKELRSLGESEYRKAITSVLKDVEHIIVFASKAEYIDSRWVFYEWDWFVNAKLKGFKQGNIVTILKDTNVNDINADLWKYESLDFNNFGDTLLRYVETEPSRQRRRNESLRQEQEHKRRELKKRLVEYGEDYKQGAYALSIKGHKVDDVLKDLDMSRICPICSNKVEPGKAYCGCCAWNLSPIDGIEDLDYLSTVDQEQLALHRSLCSGGHNGPAGSFISREAHEKEVEALKKALEAEKAKKQEPAGQKKMSWLSRNAKGVVITAGIMLLYVLFGAFYMIGDASDEAENYRMVLHYTRETLNDLLADTPIVVTNIKVWNGDDNPDDPIYASKSTYLHTSADYICKSNFDDKIYVKIIGPSGLSTGSSSPDGYSFSKDIFVPRYKATRLSMPGWGSDEEGNWPAGNYKVEYWYNGNCIGERNFKIR